MASRKKPEPPILIPFKRPPPKDTLELAEDEIQQICLVHPNARSLRVGQRFWFGKVCLYVLDKAPPKVWLGETKPPRGVRLR